MKTIIIDTADGQKTAYIYGDRSLLSELEDENINIDHSCRQGHCGCCIVNLIAGKVRHQPSLVPLSQGEILACQCTPESEILHIALRQ